MICRFEDGEDTTIRTVLTRGREHADAGDGRVMASHVAVPRAHAFRLAPGVW